MHLSCYSPCSLFSFGSFQPHELHTRQSYAHSGGLHLSTALAERLNQQLTLFPQKESSFTATNIATAAKDGSTSASRKVVLLLSWIQTHTDPATSSSLFLPLSLFLHSLLLSLFLHSLLSSPLYSAPSLLFFPLPRFVFFCFPSCFLLIFTSLLFLFPTLHFFCCSLIYQ